MPNHLTNNQISNFLDIDFSSYLTPISSNVNSNSSNNNNNNNQNISNNTLFNSNPNLAFNDFGQAQTNPLNEYSYSLDHLLNKDDLNLNGFVLEPEPVHQVHNHSYLKSRLSAPNKLSSSTSCSYLTNYNHQNHMQSHSNQSVLNNNNNNSNQTNSIISQLKSHLVQRSLSNTISLNQQQTAQLDYQIYNEQASNQTEYQPQTDFQLDDFNLPTPTDSSVDSIIIEQVQQEPTSQQELINQNVSSNVFNLATSTNFIQTAQNQAQGLISRSNSQPDLANTINLTYYNYYYNNHPNALSSNNQVNYSASLNHSNHHQTSILMNSTKMRRYPSLTYKTSFSECCNEEEFSNFNINDYIHHNSNLNQTHINSNTYPNGFINNTFNQANSISSFSATTSGVSSSSSLTTTSQDDGLFLGVDAITDFLNKNTGNCSDFLDDLPDLEDLMSLVTFESSSSASSSAAAPSISSGISIQSNQINNSQLYDEVKNLNLNSILASSSTTATTTTTTTPPATISSSNNESEFSTSLTNSNLASSFINPLSNFYDYNNDIESLLIDQNFVSNLSNNLNDSSMNSERTTRSAPPSPTPQRKKQRPTTNLPWHKLWTKMDDDEKSKTVECLTRIINDEMGLREQLEIIRILNPDTKLRPNDTQFVIDLKMIDDEKFKRIKDIIKIYGLSFNEKSLLESTDCPLAKRELRIKRAQQRLKLKQKKEQRQVLKENKSGLFCKTEVVPLKRVLPEEDVDIDILS